MRRRILLMLSAAALLCVTTNVCAQNASLRLDARVEHVAGENAYLSAGADAGLAAGDTLGVLQDEVSLGRVRVVSVSAGRSLVAFVGAPFPITRGMELTVARGSSAISEPVARAAPKPADTTRTSIFARPAAAATPAALPVSTGPRFAGRVQVGTSTLWSSTSSLGGGDGTTRQFATPFVSLRGRVSDLPADLLVNLNGRVSYRYRSTGSFDEPTDFRLYHASIEKHVSMFQIEAGRFYNQHDRYSGYLDGLRLHAGTPTAGVGVTAGFQPDRADGFVSIDLPKYTVFGHVRVSPRPLRIDLAAVAGQVLPQTDGLVNRTFAGASARVSTDRAALSTDVLVDRALESGDFVFSRFLVRGSWTALPRLRLRARYYHRRPYLLFGSIQTLAKASDRVGGGLSYSLGGRLLRGTVLRADVSQSMRGDVTSLTYSGGVFVPRLPGIDLGLNLSGSLWTRDGHESVYVLAALTRTFGLIHTSIGYQFQQSPLLTESLTTHGVEGTLQIPLLDGVSATVQASGQFGQTVSNARLYTGLWWRL